MNLMSKHEYFDLALRWVQQRKRIHLNYSRPIFEVIGVLNFSSPGTGDCGNIIYWRFHISILMPSTDAIQTGCKSFQTKKRTKSWSNRHVEKYNCFGFFFQVTKCYVENISSQKDWDLQILHVARAIHAAVNHHDK